MEAAAGSKDAELGKPSLRAFARKSIQRSRELRRRRARVLAPGEELAGGCIVDLAQALTEANSAAAAGSEQEQESASRWLAPEVEAAPEELELRLLWWARETRWAQVEEALASKQVCSQLASLRVARCEGTLWTLLHYVARDNRWALIERLVRQAGYQVDARAHDHLTPLQLACLCLPQRGPDCEASVRALLAHRASPEARGGPRQQSALHLCASKASSSSLGALQLVLEAASEEARLQPDADGQIPLFLAIEAGNEGAVQELLRGTLTREQLLFKRPINDDSALHVATKRRDIEILKLLLDAGSPLDLCNGRGQTALHLAAASELEEFVRLLCQAGADPDVQDAEHQSPLHLATARGYQRIMDILSEKFKASIMHRTKDGSTLMHLASSAYNAQAALTFIRKGIPIHMPNKEGAKCIHIASIRGHVEVVKAIVAKGESVDCRTKDGLTPLHLAVKFGQRELVEALLGLGANLELKAQRTGETPLHLATLVEGGEECVDLLIRSGAEVDAVEGRGETPLHYSVRANNLRACHLLLTDGAQVELRNELGENVLHVAVRESLLPLIRDCLLAHVLRAAGRAASGSGNCAPSGSLQVAPGRPLAQRLINQTNLKGESSLHYAASLTGELSHEPDEDRHLIRLLLVNGADCSLATTELLQTPLHYCCQTGNTRLLQELLGHLEGAVARAACNKPAKALWTPLFYACHHGHPHTIRMLINQSARIDVFDELGEAPLHVAVRRGHEQVVDILLEHSAFVNVRNKPGLTPLHIAAQLGHNSMCLQLVREHGAILDSMTLIKQTPLHLAAESGRLEVCKSLLLELGSDLNAVDNQSQTPLHLAARKNHADVLKLFLSAKPELVSLANKEGYTCAHIAAMNGSLEAVRELLRFNREAVINNRIRRTNSSALHLASERGHAEIVRLLLNSGARANDENGLGQTALHLAAANGHLRVLHIVRAVDWKLCSRRNGLTALHVASASGQTEFVADMLRGRVPGGIRSERSSIEPKADFGLTPLHLACMNGHEGVVRMLLNSAGVQVDSPSEIKRTLPVHLAAQGGHLLVAGLLISRSTDGLTEADAHGCTALHLAAAHGHRDMVGLLIGQGAPINFQDQRGWAPLHHAAKQGYLEVCKLLVESGAEPALACDQGRVPLCMAAASGHKQVLSYLLRKEHDSLQLMQDRHFLVDLMACSKQHSNRPIQEFILLTPDGQAPIDIAVRLAKSYEILVEKDKDRARDLVVARDLCDQVATDLLTIVASMNQSTALLKSIDCERVQFLDLLIELERKDVVSQHSVQRYLSDVWIGSLAWPLWRFLLLFAGFLLCPPLWVAVSCPVGHQLARVPVIKFMSYLVSHLFFILLLCLTTINPWLPIYAWHSSWPPPLHEWLLLLWLTGLLATTLSNPPDRAGLGSIKLINLSLGFSALLVHLLTLFLPLDQLPYILFARNQLLALVLLLSFVELLNFLTFHHLFGPWAVIIQDLMKDMMRFLVIMAIFLVGFSLALSALYAPVFQPLQQAGVQANATTSSAGLEFQSPLFTFEMLFFALFGLVEPDQMPPLHTSPAVAKVLVKLVFGVYMMITVVVLINLLIAMMSNTYQRIEARSDIEWKFGRAKLIRNMIRTSATPSPLILVVGVWLELWVEWRRRRLEEARMQRATLAAFNRKSSLSEAAQRAARTWMSRAPRLAARLEADREAARHRRRPAPHTPTSGAPPNQAASDNNNKSQQQQQQQQPEAAALQLIHEVVAWPLVARAYWDSVGAAAALHDEQQRAPPDEPVAP